ncbi:MAG: NUDIX hydrolase [Isosphaeraceae bacterium]|nr:NUDIX hydrolase [Isosphaeraceae bacterium]
MDRSRSELDLEPARRPAEPRDAEPDRSNPWTTLDSRPIYENPWIALREDSVLRPDGNPGIYGVVHFKNLAVGVLPVDSDGSIRLVGQFRYPLGRYSWEIPEGGGPPGEAPEETARRELLEETGLVAGKLERIVVSHLSNSVSDELAVVFRATDLTEGPSSPEGTERIEVRSVDWPTAWSMLQAGEITDSMSVMAILHEAVRRGGSVPIEPDARGTTPAMLDTRADPR